MKLHHLNAGWLHKPPGPRASCHCLLIEGRTGLVLVDTGIGLEDVRDPEGRIGRQTIDAAGFQFREEETAARQIERLGLRPEDVTDIVLTHADPDHAGGLADFPNATVHLSAEELAAVGANSGRYAATQFRHGPKWRTHAVRESDRRWFGIEAAPLPIGLPTEILLVWLPGHTLGHCGVAVRNEETWTLHVGDAYYLRVELTTDDHPVSQLTEMRAEDNGLRKRSLEHLRRLAREHAGEITLFGYHDVGEFPTSVDRPAWRAQPG